jgi:phosphatidylinositol kinase/protein kinase (PI-3  family)
VIQVFETMNTLFDADVECATRALHVRTYPVFPMTTRIGLIGWVDNTMVIKELTDSKRGSREDIGKETVPLKKDHNAWIPCVTHTDFCLFVYLFVVICLFFFV